MTGAGSETERSPGTSALPLAVAATTYAALVLAAGRLLRDPDCHFHVALGRSILERGSIPRLDTLSHSMPGAPWTAHEWLAQILFALAHALGGWSLVVAVAAAAVALALHSLAGHLVRFLAPRHVVVVVAFALMLVAPHLHARPHVLALPCLVAFANELALARAEGRMPRIAYALLVVAWANLHASFPLAPLLAAAFGLEAVLASAQAARSVVLRGWVGFVVAVALAGVLTPHGVSGYVYALGFAGEPAGLGSVVEWRPPDFRVFQPLTAWLLVLVGTGFALGLRVPWLRLVLLLGLVYFALRHARHGELLGLLAPLLLAPSLAAVLPGASPAPRTTTRVKPLATALAGVALAAHTLLVAHLAPARTAPDTTPDRALAAARAAGVEGPVLNAYGFGGYLVARGVPTFVDLRTDLFRAAFFERYERAVLAGDQAALDAILTRYAIGWTLLQPGMPAVAVLDRLPGWVRLHADEVSVVHARVSPAARGGAPARP